MSNINKLIDVLDCPLISKEVDNELILCFNQYGSKMKVMFDAVPDLFKLMKNPSSITFYRDKDSKALEKQLDLRSSKGIVVSNKNTFDLHTVFYEDGITDLYFVVKTYNPQNWLSRAITIKFMKEEDIIAKQVAQGYNVIYKQIGNERVMIAVPQQQGLRLTFYIPI